MKQFCLGVVLAIGLTLPAFGQSSLREQLVGTWTLVSCDGLACAGNNGTFILEANGRYAMIIAARGRPKLVNPGRGRAAYTAEEYKASAMGFVGQFGTWSVNEADKTITYHVDGSLISNLEGLDSKFTANITGDDFTQTRQQPGFQPDAVWRRVKQ